jgi:hypothetical protein
LQEINYLLYLFCAETIWCPNATKHGEHSENLKGHKYFFTKNLFAAFGKMHALDVKDRRRSTTPVSSRTHTKLTQNWKSGTHKHGIIFVLQPAAFSLDSILLYSIISAKTD